MDIYKALNSDTSLGDEILTADKTVTWLNSIKGIDDQCQCCWNFVLYVCQPKAQMRIIIIDMTYIL